jgi:thiamine-phosphate pyrophosphorylase
MMRKISFCFITDRRLSKNGIVDDVRKALAGGARVIQYRDKEAGTGEMLQNALEIRRLASGAGALFIINDRADLCLAAGADGVHLGQEDMPLAAARKLLRGKIIGVTVHGVEEALRAESGGADYLGVSPIFPTSTKKDAGKAIGLEALRQIRANVKIPLLAIGGITLANAASVVAAGADGVCAISATVGNDVEGQVRKFVGMIGSSPRPKGESRNSAGW